MSGHAGSAEPAPAGVLAEIGEEVRRRRTAGELLPSFERQLDEAFAGLSPGGEKGTFGRVLEVADRSSYVDIEVPVRSNLPAGGLVKRAVRKVLWWYVDYVVQQVNRFTAATTRVLHLVDSRVAKLERESGDADAAVRLAPPFDPEPWVELVASEMSSVPGPVLHTGCADGRLLAALRNRGVVAYGVDVRDDLLDQAAAAGLDVRLDHPLRHLERLEDGSLGGVVLSGFVDLLAVPDHYHLVELARAKLRPGGVVVVLGTRPEAWTGTAPVAVIDLSPGRPLHAETWSHLLAADGFDRTEAHGAAGAGTSADGRGTFGVVGVRSR
jgi:SAM-dependent methyltransferase